MDKLRITGARPLSGHVRIGGAKNAALPALAATLLTAEPVTLRNVPQVRDVRTMIRVLEQLGATTGQDDEGNDIIDPLIGLSAEDLGLAFHVLIEDRFVRVQHVPTHRVGERLGDRVRP